MQIHIAHSPDSDDAFMFYAINSGKIDTTGYECVDVLSDIETLNQEALKGTYEVSAISIHALPSVAERYALLSSGASMGDNYGPIVVAREAFNPTELAGRKVAIPGTLTSAFLALRLFQPDFKYEVFPFDQVTDAVKQGKADAGLVIHEGQLTYQEEGLHLILDLGRWWYEKTKGLPLPLGGNVIRKDLGKEHMERISSILRDSIEYSLAHRGEALDYALSFARGMTKNQADRFVGMYVNELTVDYGERGRQSVKLFLAEAHAKGLINTLPDIAFI